jgi:hypothetical protein
MSPPSRTTLVSIARFAGSDIYCHHDPGVARCALTPGYYLSRLQREEGIDLLSQVTVIRLRRSDNKAPSSRRAPK